MAQRRGRVRIGKLTYCALLYSNSYISLLNTCEAKKKVGHTNRIKHRMRGAERGLYSIRSEAT